MSNLKGNLSWGQRFALIKDYKLTDAQVQETFGVEQDELLTAREMLIGGTFKVDKSFDTSPYASMFNATAPTSKKAKTAEVTAPISKPSEPRSATKPVAAPKKRGKKGDKIANAFAAIPNEPTSATQFAEDNSVSLAVLRQSKRFDKSGLDGRVRVKKDKATGGLMIWREAAE